ncbi:MAG: hypothetical protein FD155_2608 [Bacteroidetes bacterium]|nr:MAG: hypothetical protein FD155_2608 [Bacteroidota bacterium]
MRSFTILSNGSIEHLMKKISGNSIFILLLGAVFYFLIGCSYVPKQPYDAVPESAAMIIEIPRTGDLLQHISTETNYWNDVKGIDFFKTLHSDLVSFDSLFTKENSDFKTFFPGLPGICVLLEDNEDYKYVVIFKVDRNLMMYEISESASRIYGTNVGVIERQFGSYKTATLVDKRKQNQLSYCITNGLLIASYDRKSFELALMQLESKTGLLQNQDFIQLKATSGKQADAYVYLQHKKLEQLFTTNAAEPYKESAGEIIRKSGNWSAFDMNVKAQELLFNGFIIPESNDFFQNFKGHEPVPASLFNVLPYDTRLFLHFGLSDLPLFFGTMDDTARLQALSAHAGLDLKQKFRDYVTSEIAIGFRPGEKDDKVFVAATLSDAEAVQATLQQLSQQLSDTEVRRVGDPLLSNMMVTLFGKTFAPIYMFHYQIVGNYLLIGNNVTAVEQVVRFYQKGRTLISSDNFKVFSNHLSSNSNLLLFGNIREGLDLINSFLDPSLGYHLNRNRQNLGSFEAFAMQYSVAGSMIYSNMVLRHNPDYQEEGMIAWQTELDAAVSGKAFLVDEMGSSRKNVVVFDEQNTLHFLSPEGDILWKKQLSSPVLSEVFSVEVTKSAKKFLLFNTSGSIHLIDHKGNHANGFPVRLRSQATNGLSLRKDSGKQNYQIIISGSDKVTYSYDISGRETSGWEKPRSFDLVDKAVEQLTAGKLEFAVITDVSGDIRITDRNGRQRISPKGIIEKSKNAPVYINRTNSKGVLITTNKEGKLLYISGTGLMSTTDFGTYSANHYFLYEDFTQNRSVDFIFLDGNKLLIFDRFRKVLFEYSFKNEILTAPRFYPVSQAQRMLCVVDDAAKEVYLIDKNGRMLISSGLEYDTPFAVGSLYGTEEIQLITGSGNKVICYQVY